MTDLDITTFIPQRAPFVMVSEIVQVDEKLYVTKFVVKADNIFVVNDELTEPALVENMAQTAAAGTGYKYHQLGEVVPVGFIASIKSLKINALPKLGDELITEVAIRHKVLNVHVVEANVKCNGVEIASCEMKIFEQSEK